MNQLIKKRVAIIIISGSIFVGLLLILLMQVSTNSMMEEIEAAFYCKDHYIDEIIFNENPEQFSSSQEKNYIPYDSNIPNLNAHFNIAGIFHSSTDKVHVELDLRRIFAWHNFYKGTLWIKYSVEVLNENGEIISGSWKVPVKISIQKEAGKWVAIDIDEAP